MSVPIESSRTSYTGNGATTVFSTVWYFLEAAHVAVKHTPIATAVETVLTLGVHYTVTMPATVGGAGSITMLTPPAAGDSLVLERDVDIVQATSFRTQGSFSPAVHEDAMDSIVFAVQELARRTSDLESAGAPGSVVAGNGLSFSATTLHVGAGAGVQSNADTVEVLYGVDADLNKVANGSSLAGTLDLAARADHTHAIENGVPADLVVGDAAKAGVASGLAAADHTHGVPAGGTPELCNASAGTAGGDGLFAHGNHRHEIEVGNAASVAEVTDSAASAGVGSKLARIDHAHAHGVRGGGTLHAEATTADAGFMSAADKSLLGRITEATVQTADATVTTLASTTPTNTKAIAIRAIVVGKDKATGNSAGYGLAATAKRQGGVTTLTGAVTVLWSHEDVAGWDATIDVSTPDVRVRVTGAAATNIDWRCRLEVLPS